MVTSQSGYIWVKFFKKPGSFTNIFCSIFCLSFYDLLIEHVLRSSVLLYFILQPYLLVSFSRVYFLFTVPLIDPSFFLSFLPVPAPFHSTLPSSLPFPFLPSPYFIILLYFSLIYFLPLLLAQIMTLLFRSHSLLTSYYLHMLKVFSVRNFELLGYITLKV